ncbi:hypothetical protein PGT21_005256 [Puccinia graminis f. sp. tritici]|uniref:Minor histocompatibility antigen H13 n=1 Tax=Puccinia graminis f. sp. tritici TaxID=56615 RepID=A0A5B0QXF3_PUCGR|nr:hypothetical protein PGTUg99_011453 [Puccinia graminis f. sp. tritici]KAA1117374.1 hypothetical protein PGT21_005256 [Puccinia graminis f. sp. tritici]
MDPIIQAYFALGISAVIPIWYASHASVKAPIVLKKKSGKNSADTTESSDEEEEAVERMTSEDAYWFPVMGSGALLGLYLVFKYLNKDLINALFAGYFSLMGSGALATMLVTITKTTLGPTTWSNQTKYKFRLTRNTADVLFSLRFTNWHIGYILGSVILSAIQWYTKQWMLSNLFALSFAFNAITLLKLDSFKTGTVLLGGLFIYDVWWVFGSSHAFGESVMVSVAKNFAAPIKITWPRAIADFLSTDDKKFAMLGLGDIVMPGIFVALSLRYDYKKAYDKIVKSTKGPINKKTVLSPAGNFPRPYFYTCMASYVLGLGITMAVMHIFKAAQPALLYLSPACTGSVLLLAIINGDTQEYWRWEDGEDDDKKPEPSKEDNDNQSSKNIDNQSSDGNTNQSVKLTAAGVKKNQK